MRLILASASPRRAELLTAAGIPFEAEPADVDESMQAGESPERYVQRIAEKKARAVGGGRRGVAVLGADTSVLVDGRVLGKPEDERDAIRMLRLLAGRGTTC